MDKQKLLIFIASLVVISVYSYHIPFRKRKDIANRLKLSKSEIC